ncbi:MAG: phage tail sheath family protein, partial [bacterium]|nr:phage tail sheath family protein [bacterium]
MPVTPTYPGVYIEEVPSGVRTIAGVATSITALLGRALRGPVNQPVTINSFADFERIFGGLWVDGPLSYAVRDFYLNGGGRAIVVRLFRGPDESAATVTLPGPDEQALVLAAASPGAWANGLTASVDRDGVDAEVAERYGVEPEDLFNLTLTDPSPGGGSERLANLSVKDGSRRVDGVLARSSRLVRAVPPLPAVPPADATGIPADGGQDSPPLTRMDYEGSRQAKTGIYALERAELFNLLCIPPESRDGDTDSTVYQVAMEYCRERRAVLLVDPPTAWGRDPASPAAAARDGLAGLGLSGPAARNAALYFPRLVAPDPLREGQATASVPCGAVAGVIARTDAARGLWKAPAGLDAA